MKSDREFLEGVYARARRMAAEEEAAVRWNGPGRRPAFRWAALAALVVLLPAIVVGSLYVAGVIGYRRIDIVCTPCFIDFNALAGESDLVVTGRFVGFSPGVYAENESNIYTDALFKIDQSCKGQAGGLISVRLQGGRDPVRRVYSDLEITRSTKTVRLVFLKKDEAGFYRLFPNGSSCFDARGGTGTFVNRDQVEITCDQIIKVIEEDA